MAVLGERTSLTHSNKPTRDMNCTLFAPGVDWRDGRRGPSDLGGRPRQLRRAGEDRVQGPGEATSRGRRRWGGIIHRDQSHMTLINVLELFEH